MVWEQARLKRRHFTLRKWHTCSIGLDGTTKSFFCIFDVNFWNVKMRDIEDLLTYFELDMVVAETLNPLSHIETPS